MHSSASIFLLLISSVQHTLALHRRAPARIAVTNNVIQLKTVPSIPHLIPPSSAHLAKRRNTPSPHDTTTPKRQDIPTAPVQEDLLTLGGRVYMASITLGSAPYTLVIDTGSSDTWVASTSFQCMNPNTRRPLRTSQYCSFSAPYDPGNSSTWTPIPDHDFAVDYAGGEFLRDELGTEELGIGGVGVGMQPSVVVNQTIGVADEGYWLDDGVSSGLMGLAFPAMVSGAGRLGYESVMFTLTHSTTLPPLFSLALARPTPSSPRAGGLLALGGIPAIPYTPPFTTVSMQPVTADIYAYYAIQLDGFDIAPPSTRRSVRQLIPPSLDPSAYPLTVALDSGTSLLYLPDWIADYIATLFTPPARYVARSGLYIVACSAAAPRVGVIVAGKSFFLNEDDLMNRGEGAVGGPRVAGRGGCVVAVQRAGRGRAVLGDAWLKSVLVVFDMGGEGG